MDESEGAGAQAPAAALDCPAEMEVLALVCPDTKPSLALLTGYATGAGDHDQLHMNELQARRESLKFVLSRTAKNLDYFTDQCKSNPSCEVEGLARFHQDRLMQVQVELKAVRQEIKKLQRAKLQPLRARRQRRGVQSALPMINMLDRQLYSDMIFPLIAAADGERARLLPQVCKCWRDCFRQAKVNWDSFSITQPVHDLSKLGNVLGGAYRIRSLHLLFEHGGRVQSPQALRTLLEPLSRLQNLALAAPGQVLQAPNLSTLPMSVTHLRIEASPELDLGMSVTLASRLPALRSLHLLDTPNFSDEAAVAWRWGTNLEELALSGCRSLRGSAIRDMCTQCTALKILHFSRSPVRALHMEATSKLTQLEILSVSSCARTDTTPILGVARNCCNLKSLHLFDVGPLHDDALQRVVEAQPNLSSLILGPCPHLTEVFVSAIVAKLPNLTHLALSGCSLLSDGALLCVAEGLPNLKHLLLTESAGFSDAGILALEGLTQLLELSLHPVHQATAGGLLALCDVCDSLEYLMLAHCPPVGEDVILQMLRCCMRLKVLMMTHVSPPGEEGLSRLLECSNALKCLALLPPPSSADCSSMLSSPSAWRVHANFPDAVVISEWEDFDVVLDVCVPGLQEQELECQVVVPNGLLPGARFNCNLAGRELVLVCPADLDAGRVMKVAVPVINAGAYMADMRHAVLHGLFTGGRQSYSSSEEPSLTARRLVQYLLRLTRPQEGSGQSDSTSNAKRVRLLRSALDAELHSQEMHAHSRVLLEAETELEALDAYESVGRDSKHALGRTRPAEVARRSRRNVDLVPFVVSPTSAAGSRSATAGTAAGGVAAGASIAAAATDAQTLSLAPAQGPAQNGSAASGGSGGGAASQSSVAAGLGGAMQGGGSVAGRGVGGRASGGSGAMEFRQRDRGKGMKMKSPASSRVATASGACSSRAMLSGAGGSSSSAAGAGGSSSSATAFVETSGGLGADGVGVGGIPGSTSAVGPCPCGSGRPLPECHCDTQPSAATGSGARASAAGAREMAGVFRGLREAGVDIAGAAVSGLEHSENHSIIDEVSQERPEEWPLQRFQRLFPERISARLVSNARGRRANECLLCQSILNTYHRLLQESELAQPDAQNPQADGAPIPTGGAEGPAANQDAGGGATGEALFMELDDFPSALQAAGSGGGAGGVQQAMAVAAGLGGGAGAGDASAAGGVAGEGQENENENDDDDEEMQDEVDMTML